MSPLLRRRLFAFCAVIGVLLVVVGWSAFTAWRELGTLRRRFTSAEFRSFRIAEEFQADIRRVNSAMLAYAVGSDEDVWKSFQEGSAKLNAWIDLQRGVLRTAGEKGVLAAIDAEYDQYLAVAQGIRAERGDRTVSASARVQQLDEAAERMFALAGRLAEAHHTALGDLLGESQQSLRKLELLFSAGFVLILTVGAWGTRLLFHETITPLRRQLIEVQELAARREKLASLGVLAAGVAHEIRNPLTALKARTFTLRKKLGREAPALEDATIIDQEIDRLERIVSDFLLFARPGDPSLATFSPHALLSEVRDLLSPELAANEIALTVESHGDGLALHADAHQIKQVLINLVRNGAESIGQKGQITLRSREDRLALQGRSQEVCVLEVEDTGAGIPPEVQERLFDPFFTTKPAGTGLGLSIAMRILERHGGALQFQTAPGRGTTFGVVLPRPVAEPRGASEFTHAPSAVVAL